MNREIKFRAWDKEEEVLLCDISIQNDTWDMMNEFFEHFDELVFMQYTGLKDKNSVEIYEDDIVKNEKGKVGYVTFLQQEAGYVVATDNSDYRLGHRNTNEHYHQAQYHEVIGNVHKNPELLKGGITC